MSFGCTQNDDAMLHVPLVQRPEQQLVFDVHVFPDVVHDGFGLIEAHLPPVQLPVQHAFPATGHASPIEMHCDAPQAPFTHVPLQQSVLTAHAVLAAAQVPIGVAASPGLPMTTPPSPPAPVPPPASPVAPPPPSVNEDVSRAPPAAPPHASGARLPATSGARAKARTILRLSMRVDPPGACGDGDKPRDRDGKAICPQARAHVPKSA
jgi:hypothetical protein